MYALLHRKPMEGPKKVLRAGRTSIGKVLGNRGFALCLVANKFVRHIGGLSPTICGLFLRFHSLGPFSYLLSRANNS